MDNFNILKVLSSLIGNKNTDPISQNQKNASAFNTESINGLINAFKNFTQNQSQKNGNQVENATNENSQSKTEKPNENAIPPTVLPPLQYSMLSTMNSHDQFVKRVMKKNKTP